MDPAEDISFFAEINVIFAQKRTKTVTLTAIKTMRGIDVLGEGQIVGQGALPGEQRQSMDGIFGHVIHTLFAHQQYVCAVA